MSGLLNGPEAQQLASALFDAYNTPVALSDLLQSIDRPTVARQTAMNATFSEATFEVVLNANREGWMPSLLNAVAVDRPGNAKVQQFFATYPHLDPARNPPIANPWMTYRLFGGQLFLGRANVRKKLMKMESRYGRKTLIIRSDRRQIGKTYTGTLINFASQQSLINKPTYIDLDSKNYDLRTLCNEVAKKWNIDPAKLPNQGQEQETRWAQQLAPFLIENAPEDKNLVRWLILDGFREKLPSPGIQALIDQLAVCIQSTTLFRLILVNYSYPLPLTVLAFEDGVDPLTNDEIKTALSSIHESCCGQQASEEEAKEYMDEYAARLEEYRRRSPEHAESHLLIHHAVADVVEGM
jgi:hypothetical protein